MCRKRFLPMPIFPVCLLLLTCLFLLVSCGENGGGEQTGGYQTVAPPPETASPPETGGPDETTLSGETTGLPETTLPDGTGGLSETTAAPGSTGEAQTPSTTAASPGTLIIPRTDPPPEGSYYHPLTGLLCEKDFNLSRPVAIMINNIPQALPQAGISDADVMYECLVEGGYTRLMMVVSDYASLGAVGSVRSSRSYFLDMAQNHDAIYVHAGGSAMAYAGIRERFINNIDGVNMYTPSTFYRDPVRLQTYALEHTLMTSGAGIVSGVSFLGYRTAKSAEYPSPFNFIPYGEKCYDETAEKNGTNVYIPYSFIQASGFLYDEATGLYYKTNNGAPHVDYINGKQLAYENVLIVFCRQTYYNDVYNHIDLEYTGPGEGYYLTQGVSKPIRWHRYDRDSVMELKNVDDSPLIVNRGRTFVAIVSTDARSGVSIK